MAAAAAAKLRVCIRLTARWRKKKLPSPDAFRSQVIVEAINPPQQWRRRPLPPSPPPGCRNNGRCSPYRPFSSTLVYWMSHSGCVCVCVMRMRAPDLLSSFSSGLRFLRWAVLSLLTRCASDVAHHMLTCALCLRCQTLKCVSNVK